MVVLFHTDDFAPPDRIDAMQEAFNANTSPSRLTPSAEASGQVLIEQWELGAVSVIRAGMSGFAVDRTQAHVGASENAWFTMAVQQHATAKFAQTHHDDRYTVRPGDMLVTDVDEPFHYEFSPGCVSQRIQVPLEQLGVSRDAIRALPCVPRTAPMYSLMAAHILALPDVAATVPAPEASALGEITVELVRLFLHTAINADAPASRDALAATVVSRARTYARANLRDPDLTPERVARAVHVSERYLHKCCATEGFSISQWIIGQRLDAARAELRSSHARHRSIAQIAHTWGFRNVRHFSRRFVDSFGVTPTEWRLGDDG
ncbi:helix-turn-helix domain-containing protein [Gordonia sp. NPDC003424]